MLQVMRYSHIATKIRAMKGKMLTEEDFGQMINMQSVSDVALYLKYQTYYGEALSSLPDEDIHRGFLEMLLYRATIADALKIARYLKGMDKIIYRVFYRKQETEDIKKMLRTLQMGKPLTEIDRRSLFISKMSKIDFDKTLEATSASELVHTLKGTNFHRLLQPLLVGNKINIFEAEIALDAYYYDKILLDIKKYSQGENQKLLYKLIGKEIDYKNIIWIYRSKRFYKLPNEVMARYLFDYYYRIRRKDLLQMVEASTIEEMIQIVEGTYYKDKILLNDPLVEIKFLSYMKKQEEKIMRFSAFSVGAVISYNFLKEKEVTNIIHIIESIRYDVDQKKIEDYLIH